MRKIYPQLSYRAENLFNLLSPETKKLVCLANYQGNSFQFIETGSFRKYQPSRSELPEIMGDMVVKSHKSRRQEIQLIERIIAFRKNRLKEQSQSYRTLLWIGISFLLVVFAISCILNFVQKRNCLSVYDQYFNPDQPDKFNFPASNRNAQWNEILNSYTNEDYALTLTLLGNVNQLSPVYDYVRLLNGLCYMHSGAYNTALKSFNQMDGKSILFPLVKWYSGLCYLKLGQVGSAKLLFEQIADTGQELNKDASELLQKLNDVN